MRQLIFVIVIVLGHFCFASHFSFADDILFDEDIPGRAADEPERRLNFENEIQKQEKKISLRYHKGKAPKYVVVKFYRFCRQFKAKPSRYAACNQSLEAKRFAAWKRFWASEAKRDEVDGRVAGGELEVSLQPRHFREPATFEPDDLK